jgi:diguanylate cyclase (GGDEF)-like protein
LTGLANRTLFLRRVEASLARGSGMATVLFLDLDDFKAINDRCGHAGGDAVLVAAAGRIEASVRPGDVAARMGGDEFAVLLEDVDDHHGEQVAGRILDLLAEPVVADGEHVWVRSSVGIATAAAGSIDAGGLLHRADMAMYGAKAAGKSQLRVWFPEMEPDEGALTGREELAAALRNGELVAHFQPVVSLGSGAVMAAEALARWRHPRHGLLGAGSFLRGADPDLAAGVDREILFQACGAAARDEVPAVHVNVAGFDAATVRDVLGSTRLAPDRLVLELSEVALLAAPVEGLAALRGLGVRIAFDDFGAGRSALDVLRTTPLDMIKVARPFVDGAGRAGHERSVLAMVVDLGSLFDVEVVAQGIEREDQREALLELGCELGQGYLLGRPLPLSSATLAA